MQYIIYFLIVLAATTVGSMTGMGGGVIIKPLLDLLGDYDAGTVGILSSATVLIMCLVSIGKQMRRQSVSAVGVALCLGLGSVVGGIVGQMLFAILVLSHNAGGSVVAIQNIVLMVLLVFTYIYMCAKDTITSLNCRGVPAYFLTGVILGVLSSFLGIGGGPINVVLLILLFSFDTKTAATYSIVTIFFAQIAKLGFVLLTEGFSHYDLSMLPVMAIAAICGGFLGVQLLASFTHKQVERAFAGVQLLVLVICIHNIWRAIQ